MTKRTTPSLLTWLVLVGLLLASVPRAQQSRGKIVVANRASGTVSVIDVATDTVEATLELPSAGSLPEPMYVVQDRRRHTWVGDRAHRRVVVFDRHFRLAGTVDAGEGVFHMWADPRGEELWVVNDADATATVIGTRNQTVRATVPMPADLVLLGARPHDVTVSRTHAYVSLVAAESAQDWVVQLDRATGQEVNRLAVGKDPHVSLGPHKLFVPCQGTDEVFVLGDRDLEVRQVFTVPGAHGAIVDRRRRHFYTTNLSGGGAAAVWTFDARHPRILGEPVDAPHPVPHNVAVDRRGEKLYVTHSGATNDRVSVYTLEDGQPTFSRDLTVGLNPFGLAFVR